MGNDLGAYHRQNSQLWPRRTAIRQRYDEVARRSGYRDLEAVLADQDLTFAGVAEVLGVSIETAGVMRRQRGLGQIGHTRVRDRADQRRAARVARRRAAERARQVPEPLAAQIRQTYDKGDGVAIREILTKARADGYTLEAIGEVLGVSREAVRLRIIGKTGLKGDSRRRRRRVDPGATGVGSLSEEAPSVSVLRPVYDAVHQVIRESPPRSTDDYGIAVENARVWRAVEAALNAMETARPTEGVPDGE